MQSAGLRAAGAMLPRLLFLPTVRFCNRASGTVFVAAAEHWYIPGCDERRRPRLFSSVVGNLMSKVQSIRGMHDILPAQTPMWRWVEQRLAQVFAAYDFHEIRLPTVETEEVFTRAIGQATDVVEKEMYAFEDRNGGLLGGRP